MSLKINEKQVIFGHPGTEDSVPGKTVNVAARKRAAKALSNAKQRCTNKKDPSYPDYGGAGIKVLITTADELISAIGLPKPGHSLDRIDPNGHYEAGNVRWTTSSVQAANKKSSSTNWHLSVGSQIALAQDALALRANRKATSVAWIYTLRAFNCGSAPVDDVAWMSEQLSCAGVLEANFDFNTVFDHLNPSPGYIHLPALSLPNARVRIRCGPAMHMPVPEHVQKLGRLGGLDSFTPEWNIPASVWKQLQSIVAGHGTGLALYGQPSSEDLLGGWIEGACLAMASCIARELKLSAACYPVLRVHKMLHDLGSPEWWEGSHHPLLSMRVLLIPDFSLDCGIWGEAKTVPWWRVDALLRHRYELGLSTVVGVQSLPKLPAAVKEMVLGAFELAPMPHTKPHSCEAMLYSGATYGVPANCTTLSAIRNDPATRHLVVHNGLIGT